MSRARREARHSGRGLRRRMAQRRGSLLREGARFADGRGHSLELGIGTFVADEGGYTSVATACALLVSLALTCSLVSVAWVQNRSADVQVAADAGALAGANVVASYSTLATSLDACVLTLGLAGLVTLAGGLVTSAVPGLSVAGAETVKAGVNILDARTKFATSAAKGLRAVEKTLPLAIAVRSFSVVEANDGEKINYTGCAVPFPQESESDFSALEIDVSSDEIEGVASKLQEASDKAKEAQDKADAAKLRGWLADCGGEPMNMRERADTVASLPAALNPNYASVKEWTFGAALVRARNYYPHRAKTEAPEATGIDYLTDSACRKAFYEYATKKVKAAHYTELADGRVDIDLPDLPRNTEQMKATTLYASAVWPCTQENGGRVLHSVANCPGAKGAASGRASLKQLDDGVVKRCAVCNMGAVDMGSVAAASTSIDNGFEHYWREVVEASREYQAAADELADAQAEMKGLAEEGSDAFEKAMDALAVPRPKLCPPGAWGCVAVVVRGESALPSQLTNAFTGEGSLPAGAAVSAAVLAPDSNADGNDVLTRMFEAISEGLGAGEGEAGVLGKVGELWGGLLRGYGSAADGISSAAESALDAVGGGGPVASWLKKRLGQIIKAAGFEPADLRLRKPVLTNTQNVLDQGGYGHVATVRELIGKLPTSGDPALLARALGQEISNELGDGGKFTVAEITIPGTSITVPLTLDLGALLGASGS